MSIPHNFCERCGRPYAIAELCDSCLKIAVPANVKICPLCNETISWEDRAVMHTSEKYCSQKGLLYKWLHSKCAYDNGIRIPPEDKEAIEK